MNITNYFERARALLASQFKENQAEQELNNLEKLIKIYTDQMQEINAVQQDLKNNRSLDTAIGQQLDGLGEILDLARFLDEDDEDYRERLKFQVFINKSGGTPEELIFALAFLTNGTEIWYNEIYPASYQMATNGTTFPVPPEQLVTAISDIAPAGVGYPPITATYGVLPFVFAGDSVPALLEVVPDGNDVTDVYNVVTNTSDIIEVNAGLGTIPNYGGGFAEAIWSNEPTTPIVYEFDYTGAGQLAEVIMINGSVAPSL